MHLLQERQEGACDYVGALRNGVLFTFYDDEELHNVSTKLEERLSIEMSGPVRKFLELRCTKQRKSFCCRTNAW